MSWGKHRKPQNFLCSNRKEVANTIKDGNETVVTISYKIKLVDSVR